MKSFTAIFFILFFLINSAEKLSGAENDTSNYNSGKYLVGANWYGGFVLTAYERVTNLAAHPWGIEFILGEKTCGSDPWQCVYGMPKIGVSLFYLDLGKPSITGKVIAVLPHLQLAIVKAGKTEFCFRMATGIGYFTKTFDAKTNFKNKAISSRFNAGLQPGLFITHKINESLEANVGLSLLHFSNGSYSLPNNGINVPNFMAGLTYSIQQKSKPVQIFLKPQLLKKKQYFYTFLAAGTKQAGNFGEKRFGVLTLSSCYGMQLSQRSKLGAGLDGFYDPSMPEFAIKNDSKNYPIDSVTRAAFKLEHELVIGNLGFVAGAAVYLYNPNKKDGNYYQRIGLKYNFTKNAFAGVFLKTHFANADFIEWALGFNL